MKSSTLHEHVVNGGRIEKQGSVYRLTIPPTPSNTYTDAQLEDYVHDLPRQFFNLPPQTVRIRARFSHQKLHGTAGFGFWNHPFSRTGAVLDVPANVWFFYSSSESDLQMVDGQPGCGFKASVLNGSRMAVKMVAVMGRVANALLKIPVFAAFLMPVARSMVNIHEVLLELDMTGWHEYCVQWTRQLATFAVDGRELLRTSEPPDKPLGFAAWVDNYRATANRKGQYEFAYVDVHEEQWMELEIMDSDNAGK